MLWMMKMMMGDDVVVQVVISCCWIRVTATLIAQSVSQSVVEHICLSQSVSRWSRSLLVHRHWLPLTQGLLCVGCSALAGYHSSLHVHCTMHTEQYQLIRSTAVFCLSVFMSVSVSGLPSFGQHFLRYPPSEVWRTDTNVSQKSNVTVTCVQSSGKV